MLPSKMKSKSYKMHKLRKSQHSKSTKNVQLSHKKREEEAKVIRKATKDTTTSQRTNINPRTSIATPTKTAKLAMATATKNIDKNDVHTESLKSSIDSSSQK